MRAILRSALALFLGLVLGVFVIYAVKTIGHVFLADSDATIAATSTIPVGVLLNVLVAWAVGIFAGTALAAWIAPRSPVVHGLIIGVLFLLTGIGIMVHHPHPLWFWMVGVSALVAATLAGAKCGARGQRR